MLQRLASPKQIYLPIAYHPSLEKKTILSTDAAEQDIEVLFYASLNERRHVILQQLGMYGVKVRYIHPPPYVFGEPLYPLIARAKIVLNLHRTPDAILETVRLSLLLANKKAVVAEVGPETEVPDNMKNTTRAVPYEGITNTCLELLANPIERKALAERGYTLFKQQPWADLIRNSPLPEWIAQHAS